MQQIKSRALQTIVFKASSLYLVSKNERVMRLIDSNDVSKLVYERVIYVNTCKQNFNAYEYTSTLCV